ncbi:MAG TPA: alpha-glucan family phosphorylase, partial [Bacillota bacterium]|nr:alpha-glucan family phosphorylase [Bacillota bacterium]
TSGQKAAVNGVLNCSVLDGWWNEGYNGQNGWAMLGDVNNGDPDIQDSEDLYKILGEEIIPLYYSRIEGLPLGWMTKMKESLKSLTPVFSTSCMVAEYWCRLYIPTAIRGRRFEENGMELAQRVAAYKKHIRSHWGQVRIQSTKLVAGEIRGSHHLGTTGSTIYVTVNLGAIWYKDVQVEAVGSNGKNGVWRIELQYLHSTCDGDYVFAGYYAGTYKEWEESNANVRVVPVSPDFQHEFELELSTWG